ncbi:Hypothetical protein R9X50_00313400 [Acrodontium crateriforme]|uniref:Rab-GAP TBC domain-containing protein n=1 Tax=Acrodontium crateriforme TaxID=150365 RepID=A0AAQ3M2V7_9PEZI|nr:Hypothetical protein R9X50_00313400 [Acrodontium crateriforme]
MPDLRVRPPTLHDFALLKAVRYEDATNGSMPVPVTTLFHRSSPSLRPEKPPRSLNPASSHSSLSASPEKLADKFQFPQTSARDHDDDADKRDSAIAASIAATGRSSNAESHLNRSSVASVQEPVHPSIHVHGHESPDSKLRAQSPSLWGTVSNDNRLLKHEAPEPGVHRVQSFKGLQTNISRGGLDGISLEDLRSDDIQFSHRGSILFGGKKMNEAIAAQGRSEMTSHVFDPPTFSAPTTVVTEPHSNEAPAPKTQIPATPTTPKTPPKTGLVSGRRKPSVQMLQAALQGGRVLSAEEISFSLKVRSMYEHGDERAADWAKPTEFSTFQNGSPESRVDDTSTTDHTPTPKINVDKVRDSRLAPDDLPVASRYSKHVHETAGGIEDWENVEGLDVDRYGFIDTKRVASRSSNGSQKGSEGIQRVATALRLESEQPRQERGLLRRRVSNARSARSAPPKTSSDGSAGKSPESIRSFRSSKSSRRNKNPFQSRDRRAVSEANTMLHSPKGLSDISENAEDLGRKKREWSREQKWRKMARTVPDSPASIGGGMRFIFDTTDAKLIERTWKGIPDRWRATAWHSFLLASAKRRGSYVTDEQLIAEFSRLQSMSSADDVQIDMDVPRTINMHIMFRRRYRGGQRLLFRVLHAISLYFPDTGYVQGMACLAATLLCYYDEEQAFIMMTRLWQLRGLEQLFQNGFDGLMTALKEFEDDWLVRDDGLKQQLDNLGISSTAYGTRWYLTLFNMSIPFPAQLRVWDVFMLLGDASPSRSTNAFGGADLAVVHATSAALIDALRNLILDSDFENAMKVLTSWVPIQDEDTLMRVVKAEWNMRKKRGG